MTELHEDLEEVKKLEFGRKIFEAFEEEFKTAHVDEDGVAAELAGTRDELEATAAALEESETKLAKLERTIKMKEVLSPLAGHNREVMETLLANVPTDQLDEAYTAFIGRILKEDVAVASEKEDEVLAEGAKADKVTEGKVVTGDTEAVVTEGETDSKKLSKEQAAMWKRLAGIK